MKRMFNKYQICAKMVFGVADYESEVSLKKTKIANLQWRTYFFLNLPRKTANTSRVSHIQGDDDLFFVFLLTT